MMMKRIAISLCFFLCACTAVHSQQELEGKYQSRQRSRWEEILDFPFYSGVLQGQSLTLNKDASFEYCTCAQISTGKWQVNGDSLLLYCSEQKFIIDSFNHKPEYIEGTKCWSGAVVFRIKKRTLSRVLKMNGRRYLNCLEKK